MGRDVTGIQQREDLPAEVRVAAQQDVADVHHELHVRLAGEVVRDPQDLRAEQLDAG
ncbi:MAG: hypothetical protein WDM88_02670 [Galbitalea sp.]